MAKEKESKVKNENKHFFKDVKVELKKVVWPTSKQMVNNVTAVIVIVLITAAIVFCLDFVFGAMNKFGVDKLKEKVRSNNETTQSQNVDNQENSDNQADNNDNQQPAENGENTPVNE